MGLVMVCPHCQAKVDLSAQKCQYCQADLRQLPKDQRLYRIGQPGPPVTTATAIPVLESAGVPAAVATAPAGRVRRPYIRRYAGQPVAVSHPSTLTTRGATAPAGRIRRPYIRRYAGQPVAETHPSTLTKPATGKTEAKKTKKGKAAPKKKK